MRVPQQGMQFIAVGSDLRMLSVQAQQTLSMLRPKRSCNGDGKILAAG